jgi:hypothetical protein
VGGCLGRDPDLNMICDLRNLLQYHILSLPPPSDLDAPFCQAHAAYQACRLAALIYGVGVVFPLPAHTAPLSRLARLLSAELVLVSWDFESASVADMYMWIVSMGGIAATDQPDLRPSVVSALRSAVS